MAAWRHMLDGPGWPARARQPNEPETTMRVTFSDFVGSFLGIRQGSSPACTCGPWRNAAGDEPPP